MGVDKLIVSEPYLTETESNQLTNKIYDKELIDSQKQKTEVPIEWKNISESDLGWVAGIIDGEGCLAIGYTKNSGTWQCSISVRNTKKIMIDKLLEVFGGRTHKTKYKYKDVYRPVWSWCINPSRIKAFLLTIYPYLVVKKKQAALSIEMRRRMEEKIGTEMVYRNVTHGHKSMCLTDKERIIRRFIYYEIKNHNSRRKEY